jgi:hypothetical protein
MRRGKRDSNMVQGKEGFDELVQLLEVRWPENPGWSLASSLPHTHDQHL